jgi:hypothetical protein
LNELFRSLALLILINNSHVKNSKRRTSESQDFGFEPDDGLESVNKINAERLMFAIDFTLPFGLTARERAVNIIINT